MLPGGRAGSEAEVGAQLVISTSGKPSTSCWMYSQRSWALASDHAESATMAHLATLSSSPATGSARAEIL
eukprot:9915291-Alexandrium_andersonii.AAC.1